MPWCSGPIGETIFMNSPSDFLCDAIPWGVSMPFSAKLEGDELVIRVPMNDKPERSTSGKTLVVASTHGNKETDIVVQGKKVVIGVNAYIPK